MNKKHVSPKRLIALAVGLAILLALTLTGCNGGSGGTDGNTVSYGIWLLNGEDSSYYDSYDKNPSIEYLLKQTWGPEDKTVDLEFFIPVAGQQADNFNTLLSTGDYPDMMDTTMYTGSIIDLYEQGIAMDLTDLVDQHMPNYKAFLEANPDLDQEGSFIVNGEKKYLTVRNFRDDMTYNWGGYMYRRDWIVKYGENPVDGSAFSGSYTGTLADGSVDMDSWEDNVVFPSGNTDPVYISDWEWMLDIFATAIEDQGIDDGYPMSLYYPGYIATGDLVCAFGGGNNGAWYKHADGDIRFGGDDDDFRVYLQAMNTWFENGWIDTAFPEHSSDMFFRIEDSKVRSGKVGLWYGVQAQLMGNLDDGEGFKDGMVAFGARQPINDIYGTAAEQNVEPYTMYQIGKANNAWIITDKAEGKDLVPLLTLLDYMYSEEGALLGGLGLNQEQYEETQNELYTRFGLTEGAYERVPEDEARGSKIYAVVDIVANDGGTLMSACHSNRFFFLDPQSLILTRGTESKLNSLDQWIWYEDKGSIKGGILNQITPDEQKDISKIQNNINEFMAKSVPPFIKGEKDPFDDEDWANYVKAINKYSPDDMTEIYQQKLDNLE